jgi:hypothetical protein
LAEQQRELTAALAWADSRKRVLVQADRHLAILDVHSGNLVGPIHEVGFAPAVPPRLVDGETPLALLPRAEGPPGNANPLDLVAVSLTTAKILWERPLGSWMAPRTTIGGRIQSPGWPVIAQLKPNGPVEVLVPFCEAGHVGIEVVGLDGQARWRRTLGNSLWGKAADVMEIQLGTGPDLDGDGFREVFAISRSRLEHNQIYLFVDALSGADGRTLWWWHIPNGVPSPPFPQDAPLRPLRWWQAEADGFAQLVVADWRGTYVLSSGRGQLAHMLPGLTTPWTGDLNGDGIADLVAAREPSPLGGPSTLFAFRGSPPELWRWLGKWTPAPDYDGDGVGDLLQDHATYRSCISGKEGRFLWRSRDVVSNQGFISPELPMGDFDGDGIPDLLCYGLGGQFPPLVALSGSTGKVLWSADFRTQSGGFIYFRSLDVRDLDGDGRPEIVVYCDRDVGGFGTTRRERLLLVLSGQTGKEKWQQPLSEPLDWVLNIEYSSPAVCAQLAGKAHEDVLVWAISPDRKRELRAYDGQQGRLLWAVQIEQEPLQTVATRPIVAVVGQLDGEPSVVVVREVDGQMDPKRNGTEMTVLCGRDGTVRWTTLLPRRQVNMSIPTEPPPLFLRLADGRSGVGLLTQAPAGCQFMLVDGRGQITGAVPVDKPTMAPDALSKVLRRIDRDGRQTMLRIYKGKVLATEQAFARELWTWPLPGGAGEITGTLPAADGQPGLVAVHAGSEVHFLDMATGVERWRCAGPVAPTREVQATLLSSADSHDPPRVIFRLNTVTVCRVALAVDSHDACLPPAETPHSFEAQPHDPRLFRTLPWVLPVYVGQFSLVLIVVALLGLGPLPLVAAVWRRSWKLALLSILGFGLLVLLAWILDVDPTVFASSGWQEQLLVTLLIAPMIMAPAVVFVAVMVRALHRGAWRKLGLWLGLSMAAAAVLGALWLWRDARSLGAEQHYQWGGWYVIWLMGAYIIGVLLAAGWLLRRIWQLVQWGRRRLFSRKELAHTGA